MYVQTLKIHNFKRFESIYAIDETSRANTEIFPIQLRLEAQPGMHVLFGKNGAGKTSILRAIVLHLYWYIARLRTSSSQGRFIKDNEVNKNHKDARIELEIITDNQQRIFSSLSKTIRGYDVHDRPDYSQISSWAKNYRTEREEIPNETAYPLFAFYGVHRASVDIPVRIRSKHSFDPLNGYEDALSGGSSFRTFFEWYRFREDIENECRLDNPGYKDPCLDSVRHAFEILLPEFSNFRIRRRRMAMVATKAGHEFDVCELSDGEKCLMSMVGDIARRLSILNTRISGENNNQVLSSEEILRGKGIVLIDELDLHLHPQWQRRVVSQLPKVFPNLQFIVSTHSPQIISEMLGSRVYEVEQHSSKGELLPLGIGRGLSSNEVLGLLMDTPIREMSINMQISKIKRFIDSENWVGAKAALNDLRGLVEVPERIPVIQELNSEISILSSPIYD